MGWCVVAKRSFDDEMLVWLRQMPLTEALDKLGLFWWQDRDFQPEKDMYTVRLYISSVNGEAWEVLVTGSKWFDTRAAKGGGGAIDLAMHVLRLDFVGAVKRLSSSAVGWRQLLSKGYV